MAASQANLQVNGGASRAAHAVKPKTETTMSDWLLRGCVAVIGVTVASILFYFGLVYIKAKCEQPLAIWALVAAGILVLTAFFFLIDGLCPCANGLVWLAGSDYNPKKHEDGRKQKASVGYMLIQGALLLALVAAFVYGAYAVLEMFGRQRNASPGAEICDRRLYDPLFFLVLLFDLIVIVAVALFLCVAACDGSRCICRCGCGENSSKKAAKEKQPLVDNTGNASQPAEDDERGKA